MRVWEEPAYSGTPEYVRKHNGVIADVKGTPLQPGEIVVGKWLSVETAIRMAEGLNVDPTLLFVERMEYDAVRREYTITPRGAPNIWRLAIAPQG